MEESDEGEEMSLMKLLLLLLFYFYFFTAAGLCFGLKNDAVLKSPNSEPESIYLATRIQMQVNRSRRFNLFMFPKG
jgi:hypothetical protein